MRRSARVLAARGDAQGAQEDQRLGNQRAAHIVDMAWCRLHDQFNLVVLPVIASVNLSTFMSMCDWPSFDPLSHGLVEAYGKLHSKPLPVPGGETLIFMLFSLYMLVDIAWLLAVPTTVASPYTIVVHHLFALMGTSMAVLEPKWAWWCSLGLLVEWNTVLLLLRRTYPNIPGISFLYNVTWILIRNIIYPVSNFVFIYEYMEYSQKHGTYLHSGAAVLSTMVLLNVLFIKWSIDQIVRGQKKNTGM